VDSRITDPGSLAPAPEAPHLLDPAPHRNVGQPTISRELEALPDARLIATLVALGAPRWYAEQLRTQPSLRFNAVAVWCLVQDAAEGRVVVHANGERTTARELVDGIRQQYQEMRILELISDQPEATIGLWDR